MDLEKNRFHRIASDPGRSACGILAIAELRAPASHELIQKALTALERMEHRGGTLDDTGDGAGLLISTERGFFEPFIAPGRQLASRKEPLIVGTIFFLHGERNIPQLQREVDLILRRDGLVPLGWRKMPVQLDALGRRAREDAPIIFHLLVGKGHRREAQLPEALYKAKISIEAQLPGMINVLSLDARTTVYKGLCTAGQLRAFYEDLRDPLLTTSVVLGHRRFSTNTFSNWNLVQPFRHIAHNGEVNTITANCRAIRDADCALRVGTTLMNHGSDSAQLDRVAEMFAAKGVHGIHEALRRMIPPAWMESHLDEAERLFYEANRRAMGTLGAWEGPIAIVGTDGVMLTAILDRMGLRPLRYLLTHSGRLIIASEVGAVDIVPEEIELSGQLEPGGMLLADLEHGLLIPQEASLKWILEHTGLNVENLAVVDCIPMPREEQVEPIPVRALNAFGWTHERIKHLRQMVEGGKEPVYGMGNDMPLAIFSENHSRLSSFLHQIVAVVTNPPIDPIREGGVFDMTIYLGRSPRISTRSEYRSYPQYELPHPILTNEMLKALLTPKVPELRAAVLDATFEHTGKSRSLTRRIHELTEKALNLIRRREASILILSDLEATSGSRLPLPMLLLVSAIHQALAEKGLRRDASIVVETASAHEAHDCAILLAYGATAVNPSAMFHLARGFVSQEGARAEERLTEAIVGALKRVMSKMGITSIAGYRGSALFEAIGISSDVVEYFIPDTVSKLGGITMEDIAEDIVMRFSSENAELARNRNVSAYRREVTDALQLVARHGNAHGDYDRFVRLIRETPPVYLRDMLEIQENNPPRAIEEVEVVSEIIRSTITGAAMSHGALNVTAHRAIAAAFNHFGAKSNSGEGGEDERRNPGQSWEADRSRIRQIASGRFGVDANYLIHADEIEIKIGQGAKPGEGGHLPGQKVTAEIARIRRTKEGTALISPPPHHDIYSIEDLAQLIRNLRALHPEAQISVKVPSITGLGTIAVGIAKAGADTLVISGFEGGTGAASLSSIAHAGLPLERGLCEAHQYLLVNGLRGMIRIRADGGLKSGQDMAKILALGADEVAIGTPLLIAECCIFCRGCSRGTCPVGIATQDERMQERRFMRRNMEGVTQGEITAQERYEEARDGVIRYLTCVAGELREILASLGLTHPRELTGRVDLLRQRQSGHARWDKLDLSELLFQPQVEDVRTSSSSSSSDRRSERHLGANEEIVRLSQEVLEGKASQASIAIELTNEDHAVGATLAGLLARTEREGQEREIIIRARGAAGQGFGFAATRGMQLLLEGAANDAVAEAMGDGAIVVITPPQGGLKDDGWHLIGNAAGYGATGGHLSVAGRAGQRFGVRNSGAVLICEGVGQYAFEYMTGGVGIVLGRCGQCLGSGMTGGELFLYDADDRSSSLLHPDVYQQEIDGRGADMLHALLLDYHARTKSLRAAAILEHWNVEKDHFRCILPRGKGEA